MSVTGISNGHLVLDAYSTGGVQGVNQNTGSASSFFTSDQVSATANGTSSAASVDISKPAKLFQELNQLKTTDPAKYKETLTKIADQLKSAAQQQGSGKASDFLNKLADKFTAAANGDENALKPPAGFGGQGGPQGPPPNASALYSQSGSNSSSLLDSLSSTAKSKHDKTHQALSTDTKKTLSSLFDNLESEVSSALSNTTATTQTSA